MKNQNKKGFTLVELVIVIAVIAILAGVLIGTFASVITRANQSKAVQEVKAAVDEAYVEYVAEYHTTPKSIQVTMTNDKFTSVQFGGADVTSDDKYASFVELNNSGYVELNNVSGQEVYLNWSKTGEETNYSIDTKSEGTKLTTKIKTYMQDVVDKALVTGAKWYKLVSPNGVFNSIEFSADDTKPDGYNDTELQNNAVVDLGTHNEKSWKATFTVGTTVIAAVEPVVTP